LRLLYCRILAAQLKHNILMRWVSSWGLKIRSTRVTVCLFFKKMNLVLLLFECMWELIFWIVNLHFILHRPLTGLTLFLIFLIFCFFKIYPCVSKLSWVSIEINNSIICFQFIIIKLFPQNMVFSIFSIFHIFYMGSIRWSHKKINNLFLTIKCQLWNI
jgi:hypothetical protein